jgi:NADH-quinone oxidoreductase subunit L
MKIAMTLLAILAVVGGVLQVPGIDHVLTNFLSTAFTNTPAASPADEPSTRAAWIGLVIGAVIGLVGITAAYIIYVRRPGTSSKLQAAFPWLHNFLVNKWYFDELIDVVIVRPTLAFGRFTQAVLERIVITGGVTGGIAGIVRSGSAAVRRGQTGFLRFYAAAMILGLSIVVLYFLITST